MSDNISLEDLITKLKNDEGWIPMPSYYCLEDLVEEYGPDNVIKVIQFIGEEEVRKQ